MNLLGDVQGVSILKDPFDSKNIKWLRLIAYCNGQGQFEFWATIEFINGNTKGEQRIDAASFDELLTKTKAFIETLKKTI